MIFLLGRKIDALEEKVSLPEISSDEIYSEMTHCMISGGTFVRYYGGEMVVEKCLPKEQ